MREIEELSPQQLAGQLLVVGFSGGELPPYLSRALAERSLAGVILFARNLSSIEQSFALCRSVLGACSEEFPPFVAVDQEGGRVARLKAPILQLPPMRVVGQFDDVVLSKKLASRLARELVALGFNLNFAPVADVDSNPKNPVIGDRSFGELPALVTRHCKAFLEGFEEEGLMGCVKHFPGHGDTDKDSHHELPVVSRSIVSLRQTEMFPFERLARIAPAMMTAHVVFTAFDRLPATMSARLCDGLLRKEFGFEGVLFSDDLEMAALAAHWSHEEAAMRSLMAGCDALLVCSDDGVRQRVQKAIADRVREDRAFRERCQEAATRSLIARRRFEPRPVRDATELGRVLSDQADSEAGRWMRVHAKRASRA